MLAKAGTATASGPPISFKFNRRTPFPFVNVSIHPRSSISCVKSTRSARVVVKAGYTKRPLDTAGAYELIDDETGEKVIVWGGTDDVDNDFLLPSKDVINWKPSNTSQGHVKGPRILTGSFKKLNALKVKSLARTTSRQKQDTGGRSDVQIGEDDPFNGSLSSKFDVELSDNENGFDVSEVREIISRASQSRKTQDRRQRVERGENRNRSEVGEDDPFNGSLSSKFDVELSDDENGFDDSEVREIISKASQSRKTQDRKQRVERGENRNRSEVDIKDKVEESSNRPKKFQEPDGRVSVSKVSNPSLRGWGNGGSPQNNRYDPAEISMKWSKTNADSDFFSRKSFRDMGCSDYMIEALKKGFLSRPSHIQAKAFAPVINGKTCIIADQSGSGKTLAYLLPVVQRLRQEELEGIGKSLPQSPRVVILVPTAELASQVLSNCRTISKFGVPFRSMVVTGGFKQKTQLESLRQELDVLIATPGRFMFLVKEGFVQLTNLTSVVLDEVDILFNDDEFEPAFQSLLTSAPIKAQYLFVTATLPVDVYNMLVEDFPDCQVVMGPGMHRTSPGLEEVLVDCSGDESSEKSPETAFLNKKSALLRLAEESTVRKTIIFCNKIETCRKVENALKRFDRKGIRAKVLPFHAALEQESRLANMEEFRRSQSKNTSLFLVCTDRASRGIDFEGVDHVVLFDFPRDPSEYVRRVGRTARGAGGIGKAYIFVVGKQVHLARRIIERNRKGHPLHDVPASYELLR